MFGFIRKLNNCGSGYKPDLIIADFRLRIADWDVSEPLYCGLQILDCRLYEWMIRYYKISVFFVINLKSAINIHVLRHQSAI